MIVVARAAQIHACDGGAIQGQTANGKISGKSSGNVKVIDSAISRNSSGGILKSHFPERPEWFDEVGYFFHCSRVYAVVESPFHSAPFPAIGASRVSANVAKWPL
jgi:hypothetical protein